MNTTLFGDLVERLRHGTVCIRPAGRGEAIGSGILHAPEGTVLTNAHVLRSRSGRAEPRVTVERWDGATFEATLRKIDHGRDLAMLDPGHEPGAASSDALSLGNSDAIRAGELAVAVGNPLGFRGAMSAGVFHAPGSPPGPGGRSWVQAALQLAPGNSGGPLADAEGRVVGLNAMVSGGIAYAVPSRGIRAFLDASPDDPALGVSVKPLILEDAGRHRFGLMVLDVEPGSPASDASLRRGDLLFGTEDADFRTVDDLQESLAGRGGVMRLRFRRGDHRHERVVSVRPRPRAGPGKGA